MLAPSPSPSDARADHHCSDRSKRVKDAKNEAQKEIEDYRKSKEDEFKKFEQTVRYHPLFPCPPLPRHNGRAPSSYMFLSYDIIVGH